MLTYVLKGIWYYGRINVVVLAAVAVASAVIGGSLVVGDSVRFSLRRMTELRLGQITHVLSSPQFFTEDLGRNIGAAANEFTIAPAILTPGSIELPRDNDGVRRAGSVNLIATDASGWKLLDTGDIKAPENLEIVLGSRTADALQAQAGDEVSVWVEVPASIPRDSLLGERDEVTIEIVLTVSAVLTENDGASRFDLNPGQQLPFNAYLPLSLLQERLDLEAVEISRRNSVARPGRINSLLVGGDQALIRNAADSQQLTAELDGLVAEHLTLTDVGLRLLVVKDRGYVSAETNRMILSDGLAQATMQTAEELGLTPEPTVVYLTNEIFAADRENSNERFSMYSIVAGLNFRQEPPLGPFLLQNGERPPQLSANEILLSSWLAEDLEVKAGDTVTANWHEVGSHGELPEIERTFTVKGILASQDSVSVDRNLTPTVSGVTDVESFSDVDQPFEMDMDRLTNRDDAYWDENRAAPKAFVSREAAEDLWKSRYGTYTSIRIAATGVGASSTKSQLEDTRSRLEFEIPRRINPASMAMFFRPIRTEGLEASTGANDFTQLFIGFSFFLILSAVILASLMFRLGIQQRVRQLGLLNAVGWPETKIRRFFILEGGIVCAAGCLAGGFAAVGFARLMIHGLTTWWVGAVGTQFLTLHVKPLSVVITSLATLIVCLIVVRTSLRNFAKLDIRDQLSGSADGAGSSSKRPTGVLSRVISVAGPVSVLTALAVPAAVIGGVVPDGEAFSGLTWQMVCFFVAGIASLTAGLFLLNRAFTRRNRSDTIASAASGLSGLAIANAARNPSRSIMTAALIAFATFVIVAVGAGRRNPLSEVPNRTSGNGGFSIVAESAQPILFDLSSNAGRARLNLQDSPGLDSAAIYAFSVKPGSDASCVNLYQTRIPRLLGASDAFIERGGFRFANTLGNNPWTLLQEPIGKVDDVPVVPVIGDMNTLMFSLKKGIGSRIAVPSDETPDYFLEVVGMLDGSVFQGVLIASDSQLKAVEPEIVGASYFLVETDNIEQMSTELETRLNTYGFDVELVNDRIAGFLAVQNTYLSTFQMLGGLGLLVGTFGLGAVMLRNVTERHREIALMRAVGFTSGRIARLILTENCVLLLWGIFLGAVSALTAMSPHLRSTGADLPWQSLAATLGGVTLVGIFSSVFAVRAASRTSIRDSLAAE